MTRVRSFFATCLLVVLTSNFAYADGGDTQTPGSPEPPPPGGARTPGVPLSPLTDLSTDAQSSTLAVIVDATGRFVFWVVFIP